MSDLFPMMRAAEEIQAVSVHLFNVTGQLIEKKELSIPGEEEKIKFDVSGLPPGIYFVKVTGTSIVQGQKIIIR